MVVLVHKQKIHHSHYLSLDCGISSALRKIPSALFSLLVGLHVGGLDAAVLLWMLSWL